MYFCIYSTHKAHTHTHIYHTLLLNTTRTHARFFVYALNATQGYYRLCQVPCDFRLINCGRTSLHKGQPLLHRHSGLILAKRGEKEGRMVESYDFFSAVTACGSGMHWKDVPDVPLVHTMDSEPSNKSKSAQTQLMKFPSR